MGDEKARLGLAFMYNAPGSLKDQQDKNESKNSVQGDKNEFEKSSLLNQKPKERNIQCLKCKRWGHANTDKTCPLYGKSRLDAENTDLFKEYDKKVELSHEKEKREPQIEKIKLEPTLKSNASSSSSEIEVPLDMLRALSKKDKKIILKRLFKLEQKGKIPSRSKK